MFRPFGCLAPKDFEIIWLSNLLNLNVLDETYLRTISCSLDYVSTFFYQLHVAQQEIGFYKYI